jgi:kinesin family protein 18/19
MAAASDVSAAVDVSADSAGDISMDKEKDDILNYNFIVALRVRPLLSRELQQGAQSIIKLLDNRVVCVLDPEKLKIGGQEDYLRRDRNRERQFTYDIAFNETATQQDIFENTGKHLVEGVLQGFNSSVFAYGATGAGKTYTMLGDMKNPGLMVRTVAALFERINEQKEFKFTTHMSYLEVYNENIKDLLTPSSQNLELREDTERGVTVAGITECALPSLPTYLFGRKSPVVWNYI